jgi:long-chain acyl-CoA synthetase
VDKKPPEIVTEKQTVDVRDLVAQIADVPREETGSQSTLGLDLGLDSLSIVELLCLIEEKLGIYVEDGHLSQQATVADLEAILVNTNERDETPTSFPEWPLSLPFRVARAFLQRTLLHPLLALFCPTRVNGLENLDTVSGPVLFSANHASHLDTLIVLKTLKRHQRRLSVAAAADYWFTNPWLGRFAALLFNCFPLARQGNARSSMERAAELVDRGWSVLIYPEGTRSLTGKLQPFKPGVGLLAVELGVPVIPIHLRGAYEILPKGSQIPRRGPVEVTIGEPIHFPPGTDHVEATQRLEHEIRTLAVPSGRLEETPEVLMGVQVQNTPQL